MTEHRVSLSWSRNGGPYERNNYTKDHTLRFQGGQTLMGSSAPEFGGNAAGADPEQMLVGALSSCHMLTILAVLANRGYVVDDYADDAECWVGKDAEGRTYVERAVLRPRIRFGGERVPDAEELGKLHERAHRACFISNSVRTRVELAPQV